MSVTRPLCEVCGKPEATGADEDSDALCWAEWTGGGHSPQSVLEVLRATRAELDAARARLASLPVAELVAYGRAREAWMEPAPSPGSGSRVAETGRVLLSAATRWREWCDEGRGEEGER